MIWKTFFSPSLLLLVLPSFLFIFFVSIDQLNSLNDDLKIYKIDMYQDPFIDGDTLFNGFNNETGASSPIVPNFVHFVLFGKNTLDFTTFLCMMAALKIQRPLQLLLHTDAINGTLTGYYWDKLLQTAAKMVSTKSKTNIIQSTKVISIIRPRPTHVFGQPLSSVWHAADVARLDLLQKHGGISLDGDSLILQPFSTFRHFEMTLGWPKNGYIGTQVIVAHRKARMLRLWLESYRHYRPRLWYYNAGQLPTQQILTPRPYLVHRVPVLFGVHNLAEKLYTTAKDSPKDSWWRNEGFFAVHLLSRHRSYLLPTGMKSTGHIDEYTVLNDSTHFGEMARWVLYDLEPALPLPPWEKNG